jgi:hypothetical protein
VPPQIRVHVVLPVFFVFFRAQQTHTIDCKMSPRFFSHSPRSLLIDARVFDGMLAQTTLGLKILQPPSGSASSPSLSRGAAAHASMASPELMRLMKTGR